MVYGWCVLGWKVKWVGRKGKKIENLKEKKKKQVKLSQKIDAQKKIEKVENEKKKKKL